MGACLGFVDLTECDAGGAPERNGKMCVPGSYSKHASRTAPQNWIFAMRTTLIERLRLGRLNPAILRRHPWLVRILQSRYARNSTTTRSKMYSSGTSPARRSRCSTVDRDAGVGVNHLIDDWAQTSHFRQRNNLLLICKHCPVGGAPARHLPIAIEKCCRPVQPALIWRLGLPTCIRSASPAFAHPHALRASIHAGQGTGLAEAHPGPPMRERMLLPRNGPGCPVNALVTMVSCASVCVSQSA
jgi:hypothetical protein